MKLYELVPVPGGRFERYLATVRTTQYSKLPNDPTDLVNMFTDKYGVENVADMETINIGDYVYERGISYSLNMNVGRSIPWIEDGLKAVERRALFTMYNAGLYKGKFDKVAGITGDMLKHVHPHGDASAAETIYRLGREKSTMIPYITPKGNFGNMEDMRPASPRYANASLSQYAVDCFFSEMGAKHPIFDVKDNYKYSEKEPVYLTSRYPNILMQWNLGIGKGAQTWLGAFNAKDVLKTALRMLDDPNCPVDIYPDTPIPVDIVNKKDLKGCFDMPRFKVEMRAQYHFHLDKKRDEHGRVVDKHTIVFTSLPITVTGTVVKDQIIKLKEEDMKRGTKKRLPELINIEIAVKDNTPGGIEFIVEYEKGYSPEALVDKLFRWTSLSRTVGVKYILITDNQPKYYSPRQVMQTWISQRYDQKRRYYHQLVLKAAKDRTRLDAICTILEHPKNIDKAIEITRSSKDSKETIARLMKEFKFTEFQAYCVIQIKLANLPKMDIAATKKERDEAMASYKHYRKLLSSESAIKEAIREELEDGLAKYGTNRRANLVKRKVEEATDLNEPKQIYYSSTEYLSIIDKKDISKLKSELNKEMRHITCTPQQAVFLFGKDGYVSTYDGNAFLQTTSGLGFQQIFGTDEVATVIPVTEKVKHMVILTEKGMGKIIAAEDLMVNRKSKYITLTEGDRVAEVIPITGKYEKFLIAHATASGKVYLTRLEDYPYLKRPATGAKVLKVEETTVRAFAIPNNVSHILSYAEFGQAKVVPLDVIRFTKKGKPPVIDLHGRVAMGVIGVSKDDDLTILSDTGETPAQVDLTKKRLVLYTDQKKIQITIGTTIGDTSKTFDFGRNRFYQVERYIL